MGSAIEEVTEKCAVCEKESKSRCSGCLQVWYCSTDHQRKDWKTHKANCSPIRVAQSEKLGRYYVATRNIKPGEIVLKESPLVIGPSQVTPPVCVGCLQVKYLLQTNIVEARVKLTHNGHSSEKSTTLTINQLTLAYRQTNIRVVSRKRARKNSMHALLSNFDRKENLY